MMFELSIERNLQKRRRWILKVDGETHEYLHQVQLKDELDKMIKVFEKKEKESYNAAK